MNQLKLFPDEKENGEDPFDWSKGPPTKPRIQKKRKKFRSKEEYYKCEEWEKVRIFALHRAKHRCQRCGASGVLQVHHLTYDNLYNEKPEDLEVLCKKCHKKADSEREYENWYESALDTYMIKKYGEYWEYFDGCEEEFDAWLESKEDYDY
ncbi:MAG: HNH endonuclease [Deltaproteobacteria bacterium]|nr:HNH endonuclease [Deltaproteobacteria bacterium]MBW1796226.1 HNH endonuclease [Deltaproteobacteria bacterium]MBW2330388.1 HNH endonuclease [Deltaproteobacteria bacterium]